MQGLRKKPDLNERRRSKRVPLRLPGRYMLSSRQEHPCEAIDMSRDGLLLATEHWGLLGEKVVVYLDQVGRLEGVISRKTREGFALKLKTSSRKQEKLAIQLLWFANRNEGLVAEERRHRRIFARDLRTTLIAGDHRHTVAIIDISKSGASFASPMALKVGESVMLGETKARVAWVADGVAAVEFATPIILDELAGQAVL